MVPVETFINNRGVRLACMDFGGEGPSLILLHGAFRNLGEWLSIGPRLSERHHVVAMDLRGHGASDAVDTFGLNDVVSDVEALVEGFRLNNPYVVGHSLGGVAAVMYGHRHPECPGVVNIDGFLSILPYLTSGELRRTEQFRRAQLTARGPDNGSAEWLAEILSVVEDGVATAGPHVGLSELFVKRHYHLELDGLFHRRPSDALLESVTAAFDDARLLDTYRNLQCRTLVFNCRRVPPSHPLSDILVKYRQEARKDLAELELHHPNLRVVDCDTGHMIIMEQPDALVEALLGFLARP